MLAALAATVLLWASAYAGIRVGLAEYGPGQVALFRLLTASVVLALYALVTRMRLPAIPPIIVLSSSRDATDLSRAAKFPILGYLNKPIQPEMLLPLLGPL